MSATPHSARVPAAGPFVASAVVAASAVGLDLLLPDLGLALPLHAGAVLFAAVVGGGGPALAVAVVCTAVFVVAHGAQTGDAALIASTALLLGAALVGRVIDRQRRRAAHLQQLLVAQDRESRAGDTEPDPVESVEESVRPPPKPPGIPPARPRPSTGNLPRLLYRYARLLNVTEEDAIYTGLALTLEEVLPAQRVAVHALADGGMRLAAGDPLPAPPHSVAAGGSTAIFTRDDDPDTVFGRVRSGAEGPVTAVIVVREPGGAHRPGALKLLATFVQWASASVGHARARARHDAGEQAESSRRAEAHGRATARAFAETGSIPLLPPEAAVRRPPRPDRAPIFGEARPHPPPPSEISEDDTERIAPQAIAAAFAEDLVERRPRLSDGLPFGPTRPRLPGPPHHTAIDPPGSKASAGLLPPDDGPSDEGATGAPPADGSPAALGPAAEHIDADVRAAIERMARRLANGPSQSAAPDGLAVPPMAAFEGLGHGQIDDDMVSAEELPLIGGPGLGVANEVGRSPVQDRFAHLLADLSDHLDGESDPGP